MVFFLGGYNYMSLIDVIFNKSDSKKEYFILERSSVVYGENIDMGVYIFNEDVEYNLLCSPSEYAFNIHNYNEKDNYREHHVFAHSPREAVAKVNRIGNCSVFCDKILVAEVENNTFISYEKYYKCPKCKKTPVIEGHMLHCECNYITEDLKYNLHYDLIDAYPRFKEHICRVRWNGALYKKLSKKYE